MEWASRLAGCSLREADEGAAAVRDAPRFYVGFGGPEGARLCGLELDHDRFAVLRAVMEGVAFEVRRRAEPFGTPAGVFVNGGASKSGVWMQILADILGRPVTVIEERDLACVGAAKLAFLGLGQKVKLTFSRHDVTPIRDETARYCRWMEIRSPTRGLRMQTRKCSRLRSPGPYPPPSRQMSRTKDRR